MINGFWTTMVELSRWIIQIHCADIRSWGLQVMLRTCPRTVNSQQLTGKLFRRHHSAAQRYMQWELTPDPAYRICTGLQAI